MDAVLKTDGVPEHPVSRPELTTVVGYGGVLKIGMVLILSDSNGVLERVGVVTVPVSHNSELTNREQEITTRAVKTGGMVRDIEATEMPAKRSDNVVKVGSVVVPNRIDNGGGIAGNTNGHGGRTTIRLGFCSVIQNYEQT